MQSEEKVKLKDVMALLRELQQRLAAVENQLSHEPPVDEDDLEVLPEPPPGTFTEEEDREFLDETLAAQAEPPEDRLVFHSKEEIHAYLRSLHREAPA